MSIALAYLLFGVIVVGTVVLIVWTFWSPLPAWDETADREALNEALSGDQS